MQESKKILIVEDSGPIRESLSELLQLRGFNVLTAENGFTNPPRACVKKVWVVFNCEMSVSKELNCVRYRRSKALERSSSAAL